MQHEEDSGESVVSTWTADLVVAAIMAVIGGVVMMDSVRLGMGWSEYGPESGYFPFYIGLAITVTSLVTIAITLNTRQDKATIRVSLPSSLMPIPARRSHPRIPTAFAIRHR